MCDEKRVIRAVFGENTIRVYQAYNRVIVEEAVRLGTFGSHFKMERMTWIKPSFLWMMYRCGWATKENQEHVLAIDMKREGFESLVREAVPSVYSETLGIAEEEWRKRVKASEVRVQWDPEKDIHGNNLPYRSIQLGLRGSAVERYVRDWIEGIEDITDYVIKLKRRKDAGEDILRELPGEKVYPGI